MRKIKSICPNDDFTINIKLSNNHIIVYDMKSRLSGLRFSELSNLALFKRASIKHPCTIFWRDDIELSLNEVITMLEL